MEVLNESSSDSSTEEEEMELSRIQTVRPRIKNYMDTISEYSDVEFKSHFRMSRVVFTYLLNLIKPTLVKQSNLRYGRCAIPPDVQLLVALWTMATPDSYRSVCDRFNIGRATAWRANRRVCKAIYSLAPQFIKWPTVEEAEYTWMDVQNKSNFPKVIGAIDGTHIHIHKPKKHAESYINRKGYHSIQLQVICDSTLKFIHCYAGQPGSVHDMRVFRLSGIQSICTENYFPQNSHLLGDAAYALQKHIMVPYKNNGHLTEAQINFNQRLCSARVMVERAIGLLKGRFRSLLDKLYMKRTDLIPQYVIACCVLHNICILHKDFIDVVINETDNIPAIAHQVEINAQDKEGVEKRNALTYMLNERL